MGNKKEIRISMMIVFILMNFVLSMSSALFNGILDKMAVSLNVSLSQAGYLSSFYAYGAGIGVPIFLIFFNKKETSLLLKAMLGLNMVMTICSLIVPTFSLMLLCRFFMGLSGNCYSVLATTTIASLSPKGKVGKNISLLIAGSATSLLIGVPLTRVLIAHYSWKFIYLFLISIMALCLVYFILFLPNGIHQKELNLRTELQLLKEKKVLLALTVSIITFIGYGAFYTYLTPYIIERFPSFEAYISIFLIVIGACSFTGNLLGGVFCDRFGFQKSLFGATIIQIVVSFSIFLTNKIMPVQLILICLWMINGWFIGLQINTGITIVTENKSSLMISLNSSGISLGQAIGTSIASFVISGAGISYNILLSVITSVIVFVTLKINKN